MMATKWSGLLGSWFYGAGLAPHLGPRVHADAQEHRARVRQLSSEGVQHAIQLLILTGEGNLEKHGERV